MAVIQLDDMEISMYFKEKVVNGVLCHRSIPDGKWEPYSAQALTIALVSMRGVANDRGDQVSKLMDIVLNAKNALNAKID